MFGLDVYSSLQIFLIPIYHLMVKILDEIDSSLKTTYDIKIINSKRLSDIFDTNISFDSLSIRYDLKLISVMFGLDVYSSLQIFLIPMYHLMV